MTSQGGQFQVQDTTGKTVAGTPLAAPVKAAAPQAAQVVGAAAVSAPLKNIDSTADFNSALSVAATQFGLATGIGGMAGGLVGGVGGCAVGGLLGAVVSPEFFFGGGIPGCLAGLGLGATIGPIIGGAIVGIPVGIASGVQMYNSLHAAGDVAAPMPAM